MLFPPAGSAIQCDEVPVTLPRMDRQQLIIELEGQLRLVNQALAALQGGKGFNRTRRRGRRHLSTEARRRISQAQKKRWAKLKNQG